MGAAAAALVAADGQKRIIGSAGEASARSIEAAVPNDLDLSTFDARSPDVFQHFQGLHKTPPMTKPAASAASNARKPSPQRAHAEGSGFQRGSSQERRKHINNHRA